MPKTQDDFSVFLQRTKKDLREVGRYKINVGIQGEPGQGPEGEGVPAADTSLLRIAGVHEFGMTIHAKNVKNLAIPIHKEAKGKSPRDFPDLFFLRTEDGLLFGCTDGKHHGPKKIQASKPHPNFKPKPVAKQDNRPLHPKTKGLKFLFLLLPAVSVPERSFIRAGIKNGRDKLQTYIRLALADMARGDKSPEQVLEYIGGQAVGMIRDYMNQPSHFRPKGKVTRELSNSPGNPLLESGRLRNSVSFTVKGDE